MSEDASKNDDRDPTDQCQSQRNPFSIPSESHRQCPMNAPCRIRDHLHQSGLSIGNHRLATAFPDVTKSSEKLCQAIESGDVEFCRYFLSQNINWNNILVPDSRGKYTSNQLPLHTLFLSRNVSLDSPVLQMLLCSGLDLNLRDTFGRTAMHCLMNRIHSMMSHSSPCTSRPKDFDMTVGCVEMLVRGGADINCLDGSRQTPLHLVAFYNIPSCVSVLIGFGAEADARDINGNSPLHVCAMFCHAETLAVLLDHGGNPLLGNARGETPLHIASRNYAHSGLGCIKLLLPVVDDVNQPDSDMNTALHLAVSICTQTDIISRLLSRGANPDLTNSQGQSALFMYLNSKIVEQQHQPVLRPSRFQRIRLPDLGKNIRHSAGFCLLMDYTTYIRITDKDGQLPRLLTLPEAFDLSCWLHRLARTPRSLMFLCRQAVRKALQPYRLKWDVCEALELPRQLEEYIVTPVYKKDYFAPWANDSQNS